MLNQTILTLRRVYRKREKVGMTKSEFLKRQKPLFSFQPLECASCLYPPSVCCGCSYRGRAA